MMNARSVRGWLVLSALAVGQSACTSLRPVDPSGDGVSVAAIEAGDRISVVDVRGATTELVVTSVGPGFVEGQGLGDTPTRLAMSDVKQIRVRRGAPGKTAGLAAGLGFLLFIGGLSGAGTMGAMQ
jgi:hypothetical protein